MKIHTSRILDGFRMASLLDRFILMQYMAVGTILLLSHANSNHVLTLISI